MTEFAHGFHRFVQRSVLVRTLILVSIGWILAQAVDRVRQSSQARQAVQEMLRPAAPDGAPFDSMVQIAVIAEADAVTAPLLGAVRQTSGVVIDESGLILAPADILQEAASIQIRGADGQVHVASLVGTDPATGAGLLRVADKLDAPPLRLTADDSMTAGTHAAVVAWGGPRLAQGVRVVDRRATAGGDESVLDNAIVTFPAYPLFAGAALVDARGQLVGLGRGLVRESKDKLGPGNVFIPAPQLAEGIAAILAGDRTGARPWLGLAASEQRGRLFVEHVAPLGPADQAGLRPNDQIISVGGVAPDTLEQFYRLVWAHGRPGVEVPLEVLRGSHIETIQVRSTSKSDFLENGPDY